MLTVITPADSFDLVDLATVKSQLNVTGNSQDAKLALWISQASAAAMQFCNRVFVEEVVEEQFRLDHMKLELVLSRYPVTVLTVTEGPDTLTAGTDYEVDRSLGLLARLHHDRRCHWSRCKTVVRYSAGYETVPNDLQRAVVLLVNHFRATTTITWNQHRVQHGETAVTMQDVPTGFDLPPEARALLAQFRNRRTR
jgi:hypothetical protein